MIEVKIEYNHSCKEQVYIDGEYFRKFVNNRQIYNIEYLDEDSEEYKGKTVLGIDLTEEEILYLLINQKL